jgi:hypothetical protein
MFISTQNHMINGDECQQIISCQLVIENLKEDKPRYYYFQIKGDKPRHYHFQVQRDKPRCYYFQLQVIQLK